MDKSYHYHNGPIPSEEQLKKLAERVESGELQALEEVELLRHSMKPAATVPEKMQVRMVMELHAKAKDILNSKGL